MINLLPPQIKTEITYAKRNARVVHYLWTLGIVALVTGGIFGLAEINLISRIHATDVAAAEKEADISGFRDLETRASALNTQLGIIKTIQQKQTKFSVVLADLAKVSLRGTAITNITLSGDDKKPVRLTALADSYTSAVALRDALVASPRISGADIESLAAQPGGGFKVELVIGFKPGQAK